MPPRVAWFVVAGLLLAPLARAGGPEPPPSPLVGTWETPGPDEPRRITFRSDGTYGRHWTEGAALRRFRGTWRAEGATLRVEDSEEPGTVLTVPFRRIGEDGLELTLEGEVLRFTRSPPEPLATSPGATDPREQEALRKTEAYLASGGAVDAREDSGRTRLQNAALLGHASVVARLLAAGADPALADAEGDTPLHAAAHNGDVEVARRILRRGAPIDCRGRYGQTPLHVALRALQVEVVRLLLDEGPDPKVADEDGETTLHVAASVNFVPFLVRLLAAGADLEARAKNGFTPLHEAAWAGKMDAVECLLERGADVAARSKLGTPEDVARYREHLDVAHRLMDAARARK